MTKRQQTWDPVTDRRILTLHQKLQQPAFDFINDVEDQLTMTLRVTTALRSIDAQNRLYAQGRTTEGKIVTNAQGGESYHNYGLAIDVAEIQGRSVNWDTDWTAIAEIGISHGFAWGGNWTTPDRPHFEMPFGLSIQQLQNGKTVEV